MGHNVKGLEELTLLTIERLQPGIGAEITKVDLRKPLAPELRDAIWGALLKYKVIFFRDQNITREQHIAFGRAFGELDLIATDRDQEAPEITFVVTDGRDKKSADSWHTDQIARKSPPAASILRSYVVPALGGDTMFANAVAAYTRLSNDVKEKIENLRAVHSAVVGLSRHPDVYSESDLQKIAKSYPSVEHPVVRIHPETGERVLYVNETYTSHIVDMAPEESKSLLYHLYDQFKLPEHQCRFKWQVHSIAMWDNRAAQHRAVNDISEPRHMERVTVLDGDIPRGPHCTPVPHQNQLDR